MVDEVALILQAQDGMRYADFSVCPLQDDVVLAIRKNQPSAASINT